MSQGEKTVAWWVRLLYADTRYYQSLYQQWRLHFFVVHRISSASDISFSFTPSLWHLFLNLSVDCAIGEKESRVILEKLLRYFVAFYLYWRLKSGRSFMVVWLYWNKRRHRGFAAASCLCLKLLTFSFWNSFFLISITIVSCRQFILFVVELKVSNDLPKSFLLRVTKSCRIWELCWSNLECGSNSLLNKIWIASAIDKVFAASL